MGLYAIGQRVAAPIYPFKRRFGIGQAIAYPLVVDDRQLWAGNFKFTHMGPAERIKCRMRLDIGGQSWMALFMNVNEDSISQEYTTPDIVGDFIPPAGFARGRRLGVDMEMWNEAGDKKLDDEHSDNIFLYKVLVAVGAFHITEDRYWAADYAAWAPWNPTG